MADAPLYDLVGRKAIMAVLGVREWRTVLRLGKKYGLPIVNGLDGRWIASASALTRWRQAVLRR